MALLIKYQCEQTIPNIYSIEHKIYQAYRDEQEKYARYINTSERREMSNHKQRIIVSRFKFYVLAFTTMKDFHYNDPSRSLSIATPKMSSLKNSWTHKSLTCSCKNNTANSQARRDRNLYNISNIKGGTLVITSLDHKNKLSQQGSQWINMAMKS